MPKRRIRTRKFVGSAQAIAFCRAFTLRFALEFGVLFLFWERVNFANKLWQSFQREIHLWDIRNPVQPVNEFQIDTGNNVLNPLYDYDTSVLFLVGKAETTVRYCEVFLGDDSATWNFSCSMYFHLIFTLVTVIPCIKSQGNKSPIFVNL